VSITITAEELTRQYLGGKSIRQLSQETGKGEWAIRKQIQRYKNSQNVLQSGNGDIQGQIVPITPKPRAIKKFAVVIAGIGFMVAIYFLYMEIKKRELKKLNILYR